jgi:hypothetical protein
MWPTARNVTNVTKNIKYLYSTLSCTELGTEKKSCRRFLFAWISVVFVFVLTNVISLSVKHRRYVSFKLPVTKSPCQTGNEPGVVQDASLRLLVSFVFFETDEMSDCETSNKRNNLATFLLSAVSTSPPGVQFVFTFPGRKLEPSDVLDSAGLLPGSESGKAITKVLSNGAQNVELVEATVNHPAADLCHHHAVIFDKKMKGHNFDYVFVLNDGVRGSFFDAEISAESVRYLSSAYMSRLQVLDMHAFRPNTL